MTISHQWYPTSLTFLFDLLNQVKSLWKWPCILLDISASQICSFQIRTRSPLLGQQRLSNLTRMICHVSLAVVSAWVLSVKDRWNPPWQVPGGDRWPLWQSTATRLPSKCWLHHHFLTARTNSDDSAVNVCIFKNIQKNPAAVSKPMNCIPGCCYIQATLWQHSSMKAVWYNNISGNNNRAQGQQHTMPPHIQRPFVARQTFCKWGLFLHGTSACISTPDTSMCDWPGR